MASNEHPFKKILKAAFKIWNPVWIIIYLIIDFRFDFPMILLVVFFSVICIPLLITFAAYLWRYPQMIEAKIGKKSMQLLRIMSSIILIYVFYGVISLIFYTDINIESDKILNEITFIKKSSFLPLLPHKHEQMFILEKDKSAPTDSNEPIYAHKQRDNDRPILIPWGTYEIRYIYGAEGTIYTMKLCWKFKSFKRTLRLL